MRIFQGVFTVGASVLLGAGVVFVSQFWLGNTPSKTQEQRAFPQATQGAESEVLQQPFAELTIPALRERSYQSQLGELQEYRQTDSYTEYITSYVSDGLIVYGLLTQPTAPAPAAGWPAIVFIHGYIPPAEYRSTEKYEAYVDFLARSGFVVYKIDLRGHGESEGQAQGAYFSSDYVVDALSAYVALQSVPFVNSDSVGLWGHSMAGNIVLRAMAAKPEIRAGVIWAGAVYSYEDFATYGIQDSSYRPPQGDSPRQQYRADLFRTHGRPQEEEALSDFWQLVAATSFLGDFQGAVQVHHALDDAVVTPAYTRDLKTQLEAAGVRHEVYEYQAGGHNLSSPAFTPAMQRTVQFFQTHLAH